VGWTRRHGPPGDGPKAPFDAAVVWLRERKVLLSGVTTLARLVARVRDQANQRLWDSLAGLLAPGQRWTLERLLDVPASARASDLERLRRGPTKVSGPGLVRALDRVAELGGLGVGTVDLGGVPPRRVAELARYGLVGKAALLRRVARLVRRYATVRPFLEMLTEVIAFGATAEGARVLAALRGCPRCWAARRFGLARSTARSCRPGGGGWYMPDRTWSRARSIGARRLSPFARSHLNVHGRYSFALPELPGGRRPLRDSDQDDEDDGA
jgi:hypothetical protein